MATHGALQKAIEFVRLDFRHIVSHLISLVSHKVFNEEHMSPQESRGLPPQAIACFTAWTIGPIFLLYAAPEADDFRSAGPEIRIRLSIEKLEPVSSENDAYFSASHSRLSKA
jgi:hypothetical protein